MAKRDEVLDRSGDLEDAIARAIEKSEELFGAAILSDEQDIARAVQAANGHLAAARDAIGALDK